MGWQSEFLKGNQYSQAAIELVDEAEQQLKDVFKHFEGIALFNQNKLLNAFIENKVATRHFASSTGYGYADEGRDTLDRIFAEVMGSEDAIVRPQIASGTHAIALCLTALLKQGDTLLCVTGAPYDTIRDTIGITGDSPLSLKNMGVTYKQLELKGSLIDIEQAVEASKNAGFIYIQRSRGYDWRDSLSVEHIQKCVEAIKAVNRGCIVFVDNCYGEFVDKQEPTEVGADIIAGSLIKNPGGGIAPTGGYIAGRAHLVDIAAQRLTAPGIGREVGSYAFGYTAYYQGLFLAPHVVAQSLKGAALFAGVFESLGHETSPKSTELRNDIIQAIQFSSEENLVDFCRAVQAASPVDGHVVPFAWDMPGYQHQVIMASGAFISGSSIELSADAPIKQPYIAYVQGGLTYEHAKLAVLKVLTSLRV